MRAGGRGRVGEKGGDVGLRALISSCTMNEFRDLGNNNVLHSCKLLRERILNVVTTKKKKTVPALTDLTVPFHSEYAD